MRLGEIIDESEVLRVTCNLGTDLGSILAQKTLETYYDFKDLTLIQNMTSFIMRVAV